MSTTPHQIDAGLVTMLARSSSRSEALNGKEQKKKLEIN